MNENFRDFVWCRSPARYPTLAAAVFLTEGEFLAHALDAYRAAKRDLVPSDGCRWLDEFGNPWGSAETFYDGLTLALQERLLRRAQLTGHRLRADLVPEQEGVE